MNQTELARLQNILEHKRETLVRNAAQVRVEDMTMDVAELPDEMDLASSEYIQSMALRFRGREKVFLEKIERALKKIRDGSFGVCENCEEEISAKRLEARPETTLCIRCKEEQERTEKDFNE